MSPWFRLDNEVADRLREIGAAAALVALRIARHANAEGLAWPSVAHLAKMTGLSVASVRRGIRRLVAAGLLEVEARNGTTGVTATNRYRLLFSPDGQGITTDTLPSHQRQGEGVCGERVRVSPQIPEQEPIEQDPKNKREPAGAGDSPTGLLELIDGWNSLGAGIVMAGNGARRDPPAKETVSGWRRAEKNPDQREALRDVPALLTAIRGAQFCHSQPWFTLPWIFGRNKNGELNICRLMAGAYNGNGGNGHSKGPADSEPEDFILRRPGPPVSSHRVNGANT